MTDTTDPAVQLLAEMDQFSEETGWGLGLARSYLQRGDIDRARQRFERTRQHVHALEAQEQR